MLVASPLHQILELARWAPSGDNTQPWRFEILDESRFVIHGFDTSDHCVYDLDGHASQMSLGALIETLTIAASGLGLRADVVRQAALDDSRPRFSVSLVPDNAITPSPLIESIPVRSVHRRAFSLRPLNSIEKSGLAGALSPGFELMWYESGRDKLQFAHLMFANAKLRLTTEEAYRVHRAVIDWGKRYSETLVPDQALGADRMTLRLMRWAMRDWSRICFLNRYLAGTWIPRVQMDLLPSLRCAGHFVLFCAKAPTSIDDYVSAGRVVQRLWLTTTLLGLQHQPELTPLIFARYMREGVAFSSSFSSIEMAHRLAQKTRQLIGPQLPQAVWIGRIGEALHPTARSLRLSFKGLMQRVEGCAER